MCGLDHSEPTVNQLAAKLFQGVAAHVMALDVAPAPQELERGHGRYQLAAGAANASHLGNGGRVVINMLQHVDGDDDVELLFSKRKGGCVRQAYGVKAPLTPALGRPLGNVHTNRRAVMLPGL